MKLDKLSHYVPLSRIQFGMTIKSKHVLPAKKVAEFEFDSGSYLSFPGAKFIVFTVMSNKM